MRKWILCECLDASEMEEISSDTMFVEEDIIWKKLSDSETSGTLLSHFEKCFDEDQGVRITH